MTPRTLIPSPGTTCVQETCLGRQDSGGLGFGDSGGPLVLNEGNNRILVGVVSRGAACAKKDTPKIYVHVSGLADWIKKTTGIDNQYI